MVGAALPVGGPGSQYSRWPRFCLPSFAHALGFFWGVVGFTAHANAQSAAVDSNRYVPSLGAGQWDSIQPGRLEDNGTFLLSLSNTYARNPLTYQGSMKHRKQSH